MSIKVDFCDTCPSRGLCLGEVGVDVESITYGSEKDSYRGVRIVGVDTDGITNEIADVVPTHYETPARRGGVQVLETNPALGTIRSEEIFTALDRDTEIVLRAVAERAARCTTPDRVPISSLSAYAYKDVCRAIAEPVLRKLAERD